MLVKWWLLAIPQHIILSIFIGGGLWAISRGTTDSGWNGGWGGGGLVGLLVLIAAIVLLFTGRYPPALYRFILGMDRWVLRVAAYFGLMTDAYPPFRLDQGGTDPGSQPTRPARHRQGVHDRSRTGPGHPDGMNPRPRDLGQGDEAWPSAGDVARIAGARRAAQPKLGGSGRHLSSRRRGQRRRRCPLLSVAATRA